MKGITPVIAIILLLLITISMVGFAFVWFSRMQGNIQSNTETSTGKQMDAMNQRIGIEMASTTQLAIRNIGSSTVAASQISIYIGGQIYTACTLIPASITAGTVSTCNIACTAGQSVRVTAPGNADETTCK